ncbi:oxygen-dependent tRNA uridine(34) hydroxylase TrhO [Ponticaulis profundi]|uniref:tRNA uridine(34) hydroxylase n=1 Tax=Ponticaulis profundi TaxID=2665222 RepID=A0ABW1SCD5_9PROT
MTQYTVAALYKFTPFADFESWQEPIREKAHALDVCGSLLIASEGINGTIACPSDAGMGEMIAYLQAIPAIGELEVKYSHAETQPFKRMKVRLKEEIVRMGVPGIDPNRTVGTYVEPEDWNALISDPEALIIDTRNDFEFAMGTFQGAVDPETRTFREFPKWADEHIGPPGTRNAKKIAMFCTGGIRCEKATAYLKEQGHDDIYHLKGGILKYLETVPKEQSLWQGECFVFDERVGIKHGLELGEYISCHACGRGVSPEGQKSANYVPGVSCDYCIDEYTENDRERFRQRQLQLKLAKERGEVGMGPDARPETRRKTRDAEEA